MKTDIPYLRKLEGDIQRAATKTADLHPPRRRGPAVWGRRLGVVAAVLASIGRNRLQEAPPPVPREAVESTKEDIEWAKTQLKSGRR